MDEDSLQEFLDGMGNGNDDLEIEDQDLDALDNLNSEWVDSLDIIGKELSSLAPDLKRRSKELAAEIILKYVQGSFTGTHSLPIYESVVSDSNNTIFDLDLERTLEEVVEVPNIAERRLWVYKRKKISNPVVLLLDTSYSMSGIKLIMAGLTTGVLAQLIPSSDLCIVGFHKNTYFLKRFDEEVSPYNLINRIMNIVPRGGTNLSAALEKGGDLIYSDFHTAKLLMLSDADPTVGKNPLVAASKLPKLDLLLFPDGNKWLADKMILESRVGKVYQLKRLEDIVTVLKQIFS